MYDLGRGGVVTFMLQALMLTALCGMVTYFILSYIFILGLSRDNSKFFIFKCGIIVIGIAFVFLIFRDVSNSLLPELHGGFHYPSKDNLGFKHFVVIFVGGSIGYIGQTLDIKG